MLRGAHGGVDLGFAGFVDFHQHAAERRVEYRLGRAFAFARRLGYKRILVPAGSRDRVDGVTEIRHLEAGLRALRGDA